MPTSDVRQLEELAVTSFEVSQYDNLISLAQAAYRAVEVLVASARSKPDKDRTDKERRALTLYEEERDRIIPPRLVVVVGEEIWSKALGGKSQFEAVRGQAGKGTKVRVLVFHPRTPGVVG